MAKYVSLLHASFPHLQSAQKPNQLTLCASGTGDIEELRSHLTLGTVHYGLFREQSLHVALSYIPETVSGVKRGEVPFITVMSNPSLTVLLLLARALVHARAVSLKFKVFVY